MNQHKHVLINTSNHTKDNFQGFFALQLLYFSSFYFFYKTFIFNFQMNELMDI